MLALNALLGLGTALAPVLIALFTALGAWWALPLLIDSARCGSARRLRQLRLALGRGALRPRGAPAVFPTRFWLYAAAALLYGVVETLERQLGDGLSLRQSATCRRRTLLSRSPPSG